MIDGSEVGQAHRGACLEMYEDTLSIGRNLQTHYPIWEDA